MQKFSQILRRRIAKPRHSQHSHALLCTRSAVHANIPQYSFRKGINTSTYTGICEFSASKCVWSNKISPFARPSLRSDRNAPSLFLRTFSYRNDKCRGIRLKYNTVALYRPLSFYRAAFFVLSVLFLRNVFFEVIFALERTIARTCRGNISGCKNAIFI